MAIWERKTHFRPHLTSHRGQQRFNAAVYRFSQAQQRLGLVRITLEGDAHAQFAFDQPSTVALSVKLSNSCSARISCSPWCSTRRRSDSTGCRSSPG